MTDIITLLTDPIILTLIGSAIAGILLLIYLPSTGSKKRQVVLLQRLKPSSDQAGGLDVLQIAKETQKKNASDLEIILPNKTVITIPKERENFAETLEIRKNVNIKRGFYRFWAMEGNSLVKLASSLADVSNLLMDNVTISAVLNRKSAQRLSNPKLPSGQLYIWLIMGAVVGVALGWILYPSVNHPAPLYVYCERLANGTFVALNHGVGRC